MERWSGRVAVVTGASAGIGAAIAVELARKGMRVAGLARRADKVQELSSKLDGVPGQLHAVACDLKKEEDILAAFDWVNENLGGVDVLVNNAAVLHPGLMSTGNSELWKEMVNVNVLALSICTRHALNSMKNRKVDDGHIIHINSLAGHNASPPPVVSMYSATKHAVTALTEGLRQELVQKGSKIKVTSVSPGVVLTDMASQFGFQRGLLPQDLAACVVFTLSTPPHVQIHELMLRTIPEVQLKLDQQPDFPQEFQRSLPERSRESAPDIPPENPPHHEPESPPERQPEPQPERPAEPLTDSLSENPPEPLTESSPENPPDNELENPPENPEPGQPGNQPENPQNPPEDPPENTPEEQEPEK